MGKRISIVASMVLILTGLLALACNLVSLLPGLGGWSAWRLWPLVVVGAGVGFAVLPLLVRGKRGLGALFIPGLPVLTTGGILLFCSVFDAWRAWAWLWPLEVLAVAAGFLCAAISMRVIWLAIPAIIVGANGLLLQFCAVTGWWGVWAALWTVEPFALGVALLVVGSLKRYAGLVLAGAILCGCAGVGLVGMVSVLSLVVLVPAFAPLGWALKVAGPALIIVAGLALLVVGLVRRPARQAALPEPAAE